MNNENKNETIQSKDSVLLDAYSHALSCAPKIVTHLLSISFIAYIIGWVRVSSYYSKFGANWIVGQLSHNELLEFSILPFFLLLLSFFLVTEHIAEDKTSYEKIKKFSSYSFLIASLIPILNIFLVRKYLIAAELPLSIVSIFAWGITISLLANSIVLLHPKGITKHPSIIFSVIPFLCFIGFYYLPYNLGSIEGQRDTDITRTRLPEVVLKDSTYKNTRLLRHDGSNFFIVSLPDKKDNVNLEIQVVSSTKIIKIIGRKQK